MSEDDIEKLAESLAAKLQIAVTNNIYKDAGKNFIALIKSTAWAALVAFAAWGIAKNWTHGG